MPRDHSPGKPRRPHFPSREFGAAEWQAGGLQRAGMQAIGMFAGQADLPGPNAPERRYNVPRQPSRGTIAVAVLVVGSLLAGCGHPEPEFAVTPLPSPALAGSQSSDLALTPDGRAVLSWLEPDANQSYALRYAVLGTDNWSTPALVTQGSNWFVNWADTPSVRPISGEVWASHWLVRRSDSSYAYDIALAISRDGGATWAAPLAPHRDGTATEHGFVSLFEWQGAIGAVWIDGRNMAPGDAASRPLAGDDPPGMAVRFARFDASGALLDEGEIDGLACDCCQTDVAMSRDGPVLAYRDRSPEEVRDIAVARYVDGKWADSQVISDDHWRIPGCPVNGPAIAADGQRVAVAWYGAPNRQRRVKLAWSGDAGGSFAAPIVVAEGSTRGRVDVVLLPDGDAVVSWVSKQDDGSGTLELRRVSPDGTLGPVRVVSRHPYARDSGFPRMVIAGSRLVFAWAQGGESGSVVTASARLGDR